MCTYSTSRPSRSGATRHALFHKVCVSISQFCEFYKEGTLAPESSRFITNPPSVHVSPSKEQQHNFAGNVPRIKQEKEIKQLVNQRAATCSCSVPGSNSLGSEMCLHLVTLKAAILYLPDNSNNDGFPRTGACGFLRLKIHEPRLIYARPY